ncbi:MAG TPA: SH3 domain-containing protein [Anaerolineales bacterium]|nr:SH3 domain-containing protein [Anaerolineales bacterium]
MLKSPFFIFAALALLLLAACTPPAAAPTPPPILTEEPGIPVTGGAVVQSIEIQILESNPIQVNAIVRGQLPDAGCTTVSAVEQVRDGNAFKVKVITTTDPAALCAQVLTPFEHIVPLDVSSLLPGKYSVNVNGVEQAFALPARDLAQLQQVLVDALNARNFETLKALMDESFMIAYWESEGTSLTPDAAIEQLRTNLLNSALPITADPRINLIELLGADPVKIVGSEVIEASPLLVSGLGAEGKDQAILFTAKRSDGSLYWYGLLFAKDGLAKPEPTPTPRPVDMNAYPTNVKYVMAQQDVNIRSGPGTQFYIISYLAAGQVAKVTGVSADGNWWRVICPDDSVGSCWVSALRSLTRPADGPLPDTSAYPTDVKFVMAQQDVTIYSGPGTQFNAIGYIAAGQTASVTGVSADGNWWRVICPDGTVGSCWVSADRSLTRPTDPLGNADVQSVEIQILESYPLQVNAIARGFLPDAGCTTISGTSQTRTGNTFTVTVTTKFDPQVVCAQVLTPFEHVIPLEVGSLLPARYIVRVNGVEASFELPEPIHPTDVRYVMALRDVPIYSGPGAQHSVIGSVALGQFAKVTGMSADGNWWRVMCPDNTKGSCWVSANLADTHPANPPR